MPEEQAGASAHREYLRRKSAREARVKGMLGNMLGGFALALTGDPATTAAWEVGSKGEQRLAVALASISGVRVLHDRRVKGTRGNIDHIAVAPSGVYVIDAKHYRGLIEVRDVGGWSHSDARLFVGRRDCSHLAEGMKWQVAAVQRVVEQQAPLFSSFSVQPIVCFVDGEWPLLFPATQYQGVRLESDRSITRQLAQPGPLTPDQIHMLAQVLSVEFPPK